VEYAAPLWGSCSNRFLEVQLLCDCRCRIGVEGELFEDVKSLVTVVKWLDTGAVLLIHVVELWRKLKPDSKKKLQEGEI
jgi:hypothetical protein